MQPRGSLVFPYALTTNSPLLSNPPSPSHTIGGQREPWEDRGEAEGELVVIYHILTNFGLQMCRYNVTMGAILEQRIDATHKVNDAE